MMEVSVNILDFDQVYQMQTYFKEAHYEWIKLSDIRNTNRYCESKALASIAKRLKKRKYRGITFIGSGNYHYVTYLLMKDVKAPFTLILFDHHTDMKDAPCESLVTCGSWVSKSLERLPMLKKVIIIGTREDLLESIPSYLNEKVLILSKEQMGQASIKEYIKSSISTYNVYISIDKDVLGKSEAVTNWDQGNMKLMQLLNLIKYIAKNKRICGIDVCGEYPYSPVLNCYPESLEAVRKNNRANLTILNTINKLEKKIS
ncbi:arginase family protein [Clostridium tetanomorphum]